MKIINLFAFTQLAYGRAGIWTQKILQATLLLGSLPRNSFFTLLHNLYVNYYQVLELMTMRFHHSDPFSLSSADTS